MVFTVSSRDICADLDYPELEAPDNVQFKYWECGINQVGLPTIGTTWSLADMDPITYGSLFTPPRGSGWNNRIGNRVQVYGFAIKIHIENSAFNSLSANSASRAVRIVIYHNKFTNGLATVGAEVLDSFTGLPGMYYARNPLFLSKYNILFDKVCTLDFPTSTYDNVTPDWHYNSVSGYLDFVHYFDRPILVQFNSDITPTTNLSIVDNSFHIMGVKDDANIGILMTYLTRWVYSDV